MKHVIFLCLLLFSINASALWLDTSGTVTTLTTYAGTETILVTISSNGADVEACTNKNVFAISKDISPEARARMYTLLLTAQTTGRRVTLSYNDVGGCEPWGASQSVYRRIVRLR